MMHEETDPEKAKRVLEDLFREIIEQKLPFCLTGLNKDMKNFVVVGSDNPFDLAYMMKQLTLQTDVVFAQKHSLGSSSDLPNKTKTFFAKDMKQ